MKSASLGSDMDRFLNVATGNRYDLKRRACPESFQGGRMKAEGGRRKEEGGRMKDEG
jgi:hypothetical protein